jgi:hypothetical protein
LNLTFEQISRPIVVGNSPNRLGVERLHVGAPMRDRLRAVDQRRRAVAMRRGDRFARRRHRPEGVRDQRQRDDRVRGPSNLSYSSSRMSPLSSTGATRRRAPV